MHDVATATEHRPVAETIDRAALEVENAWLWATVHRLVELLDPEQGARLAAELGLDEVPS